MTDVDWLAVEHVIDGHTLRLKHDELRMVVRRVRHRLATIQECRAGSVPVWKISIGALAARMHVSDRTVARILNELAPAVERICPVCQQKMWVHTATAVVEAHGNSIYEECVMSGRQLLKGLAAVRPDLYMWIGEPA